MASYPLPSFHFKVTYGGQTEIRASEVTGLVAERQVIDYREGSSPDFNVQRYPGLAKLSNLTVKRAVVANDNEIYDWFDTTALMSKVTRRDITITMLDETHQPVMSWSISKAFPVKIEASPLKGSANEMAIESMELAHEGFRLVKG